MHSLGWPFVAVAALVALAAPAAAQAPAAPPQPGAGQSLPAVPPPDGYTYNPEGRRDPFVSLLARGAETDKPASRTAEGLAGLAVAEISVRGVVQSRGGYLAMVQGPDNKTYVVRANDRLLDGTVKAVTAQGLVILQEVNDPLSLVKQKEVRKGLRASDEGK